MIELRDVSVCFKQKEKEIQAVDSVWNRRLLRCREKYVSSCDEFAAETNSRRSHCQSDEFESALSQRIAKRKKGHRYDLSAFQSNGKPNYF